MNWKRLLALLVRGARVFFGLIFPIGVLATGLPGIDAELSKSTKATLIILSILLAIITFYYKKITGKFSKFLYRRNSDFANVLWPDEPPRIGSESNLLKKAWGIIAARCDKRLEAVEVRPERDKLAALPHRFVRYGTIEEFLASEAAVPKSPTPPVVGELPPLGKYPVVAVVGAAGSGKSYALLQQVCRHLVPYEEEQSGTLVLPVYLDLAEWQKLGDPSGEHRLERWACAFICQEYTEAKPTKQNTINLNEATWLLHTPAKPAVKVVLCLDGLDELPATYQQQCLEAIMEYKGAGGYVVFTCRRKELLTRLGALSEDLKETDCRFFDLPDFNTPEQVEEVIIRHQLGPELAQPAALTDLAPAVRRAACEQATPLIRCLHQYKMHEYLNAPLLVNLFVKVFPTLDQRVLEALADSSQLTIVPQLWAEYEDRQWQSSGQYKDQFGPNFWPAFRTSLYHIAVQAGGNSFTIDTIQPAYWLGRPIAERYGLPALATAAAPAALPGPDAPAAQGLPTLTGQLRWYYFASRLLVGVLLAVAVGAVLAGPTTFLGDGVLIGVLTAQFTMWRNYRPELQLAQRQQGYVLQVMGFVAVLMLVCGFYEGFKVPRKPDDMQLWGVFSSTQALFGIAVGLIAGTVLGFRRIHTRDKDISLVELLGLKWLEALWVGLVVGGVGLGLVVGVLAAAQVHWFPHNTLGSWLLQSLPDWQQRLHLLGLVATYPAVANALAALALGVCVGGGVGFVLVTLLAILDRQNSMLEEEERNKSGTRHYGVGQSARHGFRTGALVGLLVVAGLCGVAAADDGQYLARMWRYLSMGFGAALLAFLWFGGVEYLQHYTLRGQLALLQLLPLRFSAWLRMARELAFVLPEAGPALKFRHDTLLSYLRLRPGTVERKRSNPQPSLTLPPAARREWRLVRSCLVGLALLVLVGPLYQRFGTHTFWPHPNALHLQAEAAPGVRVLNDSTITVLRGGRLQLAIAGQVHVGDIIGSVGPQGVAYGFLGIALHHAYDRFLNANHGALLYKIERPLGAGGSTRWQPLLSPAASGSISPRHRWQITLPEPVHAGEQVRFAVNDAEWQNNSGSFTLRFTQSPAAPATGRVSHPNATKRQVGVGAGHRSGAR